MANVKITFLVTRKLVETCEVTVELPETYSLIEAKNQAMLIADNGDNWEQDFEATTTSVQIKGRIISA